MQTSDTPRVKAATARLLKNLNRVFIDTTGGAIFVSHDLVDEAAEMFAAKCKPDNAMAMLLILLCAAHDLYDSAGPGARKSLVLLRKELTREMLDIQSQLEVK